MIITNTSRIDNILFQLYFLMTVFFIPYSYRQVTYIFMFIMVLIHILIVKKNENALTMKGKYLLFMMAVLFFCGFAILTSEYSQFYLIMAYFPILIVFLWEKNGLLRLGRMNERILCYFVLILFMIENIALYISDNSIFGFVSVFNDSVFRDYIIAFFIIYLLRSQYYIGSILLIISRMISSSGRGFLLILVSYILVVACKYFFPNFSKKLVDLLKKPYVLFFINILLVILITAFSYFWIRVVVPTGIVEYRTGLNDLSNQQRFTSNIFAFEQLSTDKSFLFKGYGGELRSLIFDEQYKGFKGVFLTVPHCSILNLLMCFGILPGIIYLLIFYNLCRKALTYDNIEVMIPFIIMSLLLWTYPYYGIELLFFFILLLGKRTRKKMMYMNKETS